MRAGYFQQRHIQPFCYLVCTNHQIIQFKKVPFYISGYCIAGGLLCEPKNYHGSALFGRTALTSQDY